MNIILVEDNDTMRLGMTDTLKKEGYELRAFDNAPDALQELSQRTADMVITDLRMEPLDGLQLLEKVKSAYPETEVLLVSAYGTVDDAVKAMQLGAADFLTKPFSTDELRVRVARIAGQIKQKRLLYQLQEHNRYLEDELGTAYESMVGRSARMRSVFDLIERVAAGDSPVLVNGESGTGKELVARAIHRKSPRRDKPFIRVNCGALNDNLLESELFGHEKGAFTGAVRTRKGRFELADGGTLFLDEIGDVSPAMQLRLLRVLQEKEFERVGGEQTLRVDVRLIAATNRDLQQLILNGQFREDLYYRLSVIPLNLPPLRQRREDIPLLIAHFMDRLNSGKAVQKNISAAGIELMMNYSWPGNIRELENVLERLHVIAPGAEIDPQMISSALGGRTFSGNEFGDLPLDEALFSFEKKLITHAMQKAGGVKNRAAKILGIGTSALYYKLEKFGLLK